VKAGTKRSNKSHCQRLRQTTNNKAG